MRFGGWRRSLQSFEQHPDHVDAVLAHEDGGLERCRARWLVGCDGGRSRTRELAGIAMKRDSLGATFILADAKTTSDLVENEGHAFRSREGLLLVVPMPEPGRFRIIAHVPGVAPGESLTRDETFFDRLVRERAGIEYGAHDLTWTSQFVLHQGLAERFRAGRVFLAGDAAHVHSPVGGQGLNTGVQDAHNLLWKLAHLRDAPAADADCWLDSYEAERRPVAAAMVAGTTKATRVLTARHPLANAVLGAVAHRALRTRLVANRLGRGVGMLELGYAGSPLLGEGRRRGGAAPGRRIPNVVLAGGRRLHDLLDRRRHTLLRIGGEGGDGRCLDLSGESGVPEAFGRGAGFVLVRPDGCVAGVGRTLAELQASLPGAVQATARPLLSA